MAEKKYLLETWREIAYNQNQTQQQFDAFWDAYFVQEKEVYKDILGNKELLKNLLISTIWKYLQW